MSQVVEEHRADAPQKLCVAVITISDTRTLADDRGGQTAVDLLLAAGHEVALREIVPDEPERIRGLIGEICRDGAVEAILLTGGTGITPRDQTYETVAQLLTKPLPGYGELFRWLSYQEIGPAAMLSRTIGGLIDRTVVLTMPGSPAAVRLVMERLILPELGHLVREARR